MLPVEQIYPGLYMEFQDCKIQYKVTECTVASDKTSYLPSSNSSVYLKRKISLKLFEIYVL